MSINQRETRPYLESVLERLGVEHRRLTCLIKRRESRVGLLSTLKYKQRLELSLSDSVSMVELPPFFDSTFTRVKFSVRIVVAD
jgi:hypothetical protein